MSSFTIELRPPPKAVRPNARVHHMARARAVKHYRTIARLLATHAMRGQRPPGWLQARAKVVAYHATGNRMDPDNLIASLKPAFDGIADSGMISNDRGLWPERPEMRRGSPARVVVTISEEPSTVGQLL